MPETKDEAISSSGDPLLPPRSSSPPRSTTPAASSAGASSPVLPSNTVSTECWGQRQNSKGGSFSHICSQPMYVSDRTSVDGSALGSSQTSCRPWDRGDLLRRLSTFKPANWFAKPKAASSLACARKGWVNVGVDKVKCESCDANMKFVSSVTWTPHEVDYAGDNFAKKLDGGHKGNCPWTGNCCVDSLVQFPPTPPSALVGGYKDRCDGLLQFPSLPVVSASAIEQLRVSRGSEIDRLLAQTQFVRNESGIKLEIFLGNENSRDDLFIYSHAQKLISLCGWEPRWMANVQDCEEHSAQSTRNGYSTGPSKYRAPSRDPNRGKNALSSSTKKDYSIIEVTVATSKSVSRSPVLDCSLCGATVRIWDFLTVLRPTSFIPNSSDVQETTKKMVLTRGISAASGISGWVGVDGMEKEQAEGHDEAAPDEGKSLLSISVDLNLTISAGLSSSRLEMNATSGLYQDVNRGRDLMLGQPSSSEVGDRAASYESRGPSSRKRNLDEGGSTADRPQLLALQADSAEGTVIDRDGDEINDGGEFSIGPSKRLHDSVLEPRQSAYRRGSSGTGPSHALEFDLGIDAYKYYFDQGPEQARGNQSTRDSAHASSVIAMDTICHDGDDDSMESVENFPGDVDDINMPSTSAIKNADANETSELNYSNQAQQSTCPAMTRSAGEIGLSSTNEEEVLNADTDTAHARDGPSFGISGGSIGMGASHEAEIHGTAVSIYRTESVVGDVEPIAEITDNQGQIGEFALDPGLMGEFVPEDMDREDPHADSQELMSRSVARADSGSKIVDSTKAESVESGQKTSRIHVTSCGNSPNPSLSCNAMLYSGFDMSKEDVTQAAKDLTADNGGYVESDYQVINGIGPPNGGSNYEEAVEFDPIKHHNPFCPWVNGNVAAAGSGSSNSSNSTATALALCGWQLTIDALDAFQSQGQFPVQTVESESTASMYKDDHQTPPGPKLLPRHSFNRRRGKN